MNVTKSDDISFEKNYKPHWSMGLAICASIFNIIFVTPFAYSITWY